MSVTATAIDDLSRQLRSVAEQLERGQAHMPLAEKANALGACSDAALTLVLLGLTPEARTAGIAWLVGPAYRNVSVQLSDPPDRLEIRLHTRGYTLQTPGFGTVEYDSPDALLRALDAATNADADLAGPVRLALRAASPADELNLVVVKDAHAAVASAGWQTLLAERAAILVVLAPDDHAPEDGEAEAIRTLAMLTMAVWPIAVGNGALGPPRCLPPLPNVDAPLLPLTRLDDGMKPLPEFVVAGAAHPLARALSTALAAFRSHRLMDMIQERFDTDLRRLQSRQKREVRLERATEAEAKDQALRLAFDRCKLEFNEDFGRLSLALRDDNRRSMLKAGAIGAALDTALASLQPSDLDRDVTPRTVRLSLKADVVQSFRRRLAEALRHQLDEQCVLVRDSLDEARRKVIGMLAEVGAANRSIALVSPDQLAIWEPVSEMLELDIRYRGEIPRRGFMQRLGEGRRVVFLCLMLLSLVGSFIGFNARRSAVIGAVFLLLFAGTVIYTYRSWRREETHGLDKEIDRVRESVSTEFERVLTDVQREKQSRLQQMLDDCRRDLVARLDAIQRDVFLARATCVEEERRGARHRLKLIEQRTRELQSLGQPLAKLRAATADSADKARELVRQACIAADRGGAS